MDRTPDLEALARDDGDCVLIVDQDLRILHVSRAVERIFGWPPETMTGLKVGEPLEGTDRHTLDAAYRSVLEDPASQRQFEFRAPHADGTYRIVDVLVTNHVEDPTVGALVANIRDVTDRRAALDELTQRPHQLESLEQGEHRILRLLETTDDLVVLFDTEGRVTYINATGRQTLGIDDRAFQELRTRVWSPPSEGEMERVDRLLQPPPGFWAARELFDRWTGEFSVPTADGRVLPLSVQFIAHRDSRGRIEFCSAMGRDISARRDLEVSLQRQATHDQLTGLPNRTLLFERIARATDGIPAQGRRHSVALLFVDIDRFKAVNDRFGHRAGDQILAEVAARITAVVRPGDTVARFGGDEFVVLCERLDQPEDAVVIAHRIEVALSRPVEFDDREAELGVSIGISYADPDAADPLAILQDADAAMYHAKSGGRGQWVIFDDELRRSATQRQRIESALRATRHGEQLELEYQPVVSLRTGQVTGVEALVRWRHDGHTVAPADFIPVAEETGMIVPIGEWVLRTACEQVARWQSLPGMSRLRLAVNVSARQIQHPGFAAVIAGLTDGSVLRRDTLWLEITESLLLDDLTAANERLLRLSRFGARLALDDFGTGYSSMTYLRRFPVDAVKLDRSFVAGIGEDPEDTAIVTTVVELARALGKECVAEGIETRDQYELLRGLGCDSGQGYFMSRPVPAHRLEELLQVRFSGEGQARMPQDPQRIHAGLDAGEQVTHGG